MRSILLALPLIFLAAPAAAQQTDEQLWLQVNASIPLGDNLRGELGYLNQYRFGRDGQRDRMDHVATFTLTLSASSSGEGE